MYTWQIMKDMHGSLSIHGDKMHENGKHWKVH